jgi:CubicO group peptidase (beta-lactamase class C family)
MRWRLGFHHAFGLGSRAPRALGHYGFGGSGGWGDPDTGISFGFVSSHIGNFTTAIGDIGILRLTAVARACTARAL